MRRWILFIVACLLLVAVAIPAGIIYWTAYTQNGLRFVVGHLPKTIARADIKVGEIHGSLAGGFRATYVDIDHERVHLHFDEVYGRMRLLPLLWQTIHAQEVSMTKALVEVRRRPPPDVDYEPRFLPRWLMVKVDRVKADSATLIVPNGRQLIFSPVTAAGVARHRTIRVFDGSLDFGTLTMQGKGELRAASPMELETDARFTWKLSNQPDWVATAVTQGTLDELLVTSQITAPFRADLAGRMLDLTSGFHWLAEMRIHDFDLRTWGGGGLLGRITGQLKLSGDTDDIRGEGPMTPEGLRVGAFDMRFRSAYPYRETQLHSLEFVHHTSQARIAGAGVVGIVPNGPELQLRGTWKNFRWPLVGHDIGVRSATGEYTLNGTWPYAVRASGEVQALELEPLQFQMNGSLGKDRLIVHSSETAAFDGIFSSTGEVVWTPDDHWSAKGAAVGVDLARIRPDLESSLDFEYSASGKEFAADADFSVQVQSLAGRLRNVPASGEGKVSRVDLEWLFDGVKLGAGGTQLALDGRLATEADLKFDLDSRDLSLLAHDSRGELHASGVIQGTLHDPMLKVVARGGGIQHGELRIGKLSAAVDFDSRSQGASKADVVLRDVAYDDREFDALTFTLNGTAQSHVARLEAAGLGLTVKSEATGIFADGAWRGQLYQLGITGSESLRLDLDAPVALLISADRIRTDWLCLKGTPARVCADGDWTPAKWSATLTANDLPLGPLTTNLTPPVRYRGNLSVNARAFGAAGEPVQGGIRADLVDASIIHRLSSGRDETITLGSGLITVDASPATVRAEAGLDAGQVGTISGRVDVARSAHRWQDMPIKGSLQARTGELGFVTLYLPQIDRTVGRLTADLKLDGTLGTPYTDGTLALADAELDFYQINLALRQVSLKARLNDNTLQFDGAARVGQGGVSTNGKLEWRDALPYGQISIDGENLRVVDVPEAKIDASPDLNFRITGRRIEVSGEIKVPYADIVPADLTNAVRASSDEIIVGETEAALSRRFEVLTDVKMTLGDRVRIDTSGLTGRLTGNITVRSGYDDVTRGTGEFQIAEGRYTAYGRQLDIDRGRLSFTGGPVNDPGVDIRAIRRFPDSNTIAGVNVRGTLLQPRLTFYSEPSLPQSQIVSMILGGGGPAATANNENNRQSGARNEFVAQGGAILAQQLGARVGIQDVSLESDVTNETSLVLGKYLSPRLYVSYGISLTEALNTLKLRYSLNDHWTIKTEVGGDQGADLEYTIEK